MKKNTTKANTIAQIFPKMQTGIFHKNAHFSLDSQK